MDIEAILIPIPGDNPSGENLRYTSVYDEIQEARRADEVLEQGDWQHELKTSDWGAVKTLCIDALTKKNKGSADCGLAPGIPHRYPGI